VSEVLGCRTHGRSLAEGCRRIREALGLFIDEHAAAKVELVDDVRLPAGTGDVVREVAAARAQLDVVQAQAMMATAAAAKALTRKAGLSVRDAAEMLGISYQGVQQLAGARR
jgi:hypothetical protein